MHGGLIAGCTACATQFRLTSEQLEIGAGWVRCGQCGEVFDAARQLPAQEPEPASASASASASEPIFALQQPESPLQNRAPSEADVRFDAWPAALQDAALEAPAGVVAAMDATFAAATAAATGPAPAPAEPPTAPAALRSVLGRWPGVPPGFATWEATAATATAAARRLLGYRPGLRFGLGALSLLLLTTLGFQLALQPPEGATLRPVRPALQALCQRLGLGCTMAAPRQLASLAIESSAFNQAAGGTYQLRFVLKNTASIALHTPALELTVTDSQGQAILRRVLLPGELGLPAVLPAAAERTVLQPLVLSGPASAARVVGYRLLVFYP